MKCVSKDNDSKAVYLQLLRASPDLPKLKATFQYFLNTVRAAIGLSDPVVIPDPVYSTPPPTHDPKLPREYDQIAALASIIEMIAELGPPLPQIFPSGDRAPLMQFGKSRSPTGCEQLGNSFLHKRAVAAFRCSQRDSRQLHDVPTPR